MKCKYFRQYSERLPLQRNTHVSGDRLPRPASPLPVSRHRNRLPVKPASANAVSRCSVSEAWSADKRMDVPQAVLMPAAFAVTVSSSATLRRPFHITRSPPPDSLPPMRRWRLGTSFPGHMFPMNYEAGKGWHNPRIEHHSPSYPGGHVASAYPGTPAPCFSNPQISRRIARNASLVFISSTRGRANGTRISRCMRAGRAENTRIRSAR
jgi:hypothetical protein